MLDSDDTLAETGQWVVLMTLFSALLFKSGAVPPNGPFGYGLVGIQLGVAILAVVLLFSDLSEERAFLDYSLQRGSDLRRSIRRFFSLCSNAAIPVHAIVKLQAVARGNQTRRHMNEARQGVVRVEDLEL